jgi:hypothetical protein
MVLKVLERKNIRELTPKEREFPTRRYFNFKDSSGTIDGEELKDIMIGLWLWRQLRL